MTAQTNPSTRVTGQPGAYPPAASQRAASEPTAPHLAASQPKALQPAGWRLSILLFYLPALLVALSFYIFRPWLETRGYDSLTSTLAALVVPLSFLFVAALVGFNKYEGYPLTRAAFAQRMHFPRLTGRDALIALAICAVGMLGQALFSRLSLALIDLLRLPLPAGLPVLFDPHALPGLAALNQAAGGSLRGRWDILVLDLVLFFFNIAGEELWWRGYILPRQELAFGRLAWLVNGLMWATFHFFKWWDILSLLPICLAIAFTSQKLRTNWPGLLAHALFNGLGTILRIAVIIG